MECGVWSVECGVWGVGCGVWGVGCGDGGLGTRAAQGDAREFRGVYGGNQTLHHSPWTSQGEDQDDGQAGQGLKRQKAGRINPWERFNS